VHPLFSKIVEFFKKKTDLATELTPESKEDVINKIAQFVVYYQMEAPAILALEGFKPVCFIQSQLTVIMFGPILEVIGLPAYKYAAFFRDRKNIELLLRQIEDLSAERNKK